MKKKAYIYTALSQFNRDSRISQERTLITYAQEHDYEVIQIFREKHHVLCYERPKMAECLTYLQQGDVLMLSSLLHLGIDIKRILCGIDCLIRKKIDIYVSCFDIHALDENGNLTKEMSSHISELEQIDSMMHMNYYWPPLENPNVEDTLTRTIDASHPKFDLIWKLLDNGFNQEYICYITHSTLYVVQKVRKEMIAREGSIH